MYMWVSWMEVALDQLYRAGSSRLGVETADGYGPDLLRDLDGELSASMVSLAAASHALDAFYGSVSSYVRFPESLQETWTRNRTKRPSQILETLKLAFDVGTPSAEWTPKVIWLFGLRDFAVHHKTEVREMEWHATRRTKVSREHALYSLENANEAVMLVRTILTTCVAAPRPDQPEITGWMPDARHFVDVIERLACAPSRYLP